MNRKRHIPRSCLALLLLLFGTMFLAACGQRPKNEVSYWTANAGNIDAAAQKQIVDAFNKANPDLHVNLVLVPSLGTGDVTSLITSARGGVGPDVFLIDRFTVGQQAAVGLLQDLYPYTSKEQSDLSKEFLPFAWNEAQYLGHAYGLPMDTDARALFYNKAMLRQAGIDPAVLDPAKGPPTFSLMKELSAKINHKNANGAYDRLGFAPYSGQAFHTTWALDFGAKFFDSKTCQITPTDPGIVKAYQLMADWAKMLDPQKVSTFWATYQPANALPTQNPFFTNNFALSVDGDWFLSSLKQYAPKLDYGVTYLPVPDGTRTPYTWSGGFALVMPSGAQNPNGAYRFMRYMAGPEGQRIYTKATSHMPTWASLLKENNLFDQQHTFFVNTLQYSHSRAALPVGAQLSNEFDAAQQAVTLGTLTPMQALQKVYNRVQPQMQQYCPFRLTGE